MSKGQQRVFVLSIIVLSKLDWVVAVTWSTSRASPGDFTGENQPYPFFLFFPTLNYFS